jgi:hypothetical protein
MTDQIINIDLCYLADSQPSICIPRVFNNISKDRIHRVFDELNLGRISAVDIKERRGEGESFKSVYIHFDKWFWTENAQSVRKKLITGKEVKIVYDNPWFWKVSASKYTPLRDYEIGTTIHKQLQVIISDNKVVQQAINEFYSELMSHKLSGKEYNEHYKRICAAQEQFYAAGKEISDGEHHNDTRQRDYDRHDTRQRDYDRHDTRQRDYDRRSDSRDRDYDRHDTRQRDYDRRSDSRDRDYDRRSDSRDRDYDRRSDSRDRDYDRRSVYTPSVPLTNQIIPTKRFKLRVKNKPEPLKTKINDVSLEIKKELEEGEIDESEEKKQILEDLYGDI